MIGAEESLLQRVKRKEKQQKERQKGVQRFKAILANDRSRLPQDEEKVISKADQQIAVSEKIEEARNKVAEIALRQLMGERQEKVSSDTSSQVPLENRPLTIIHQEQRRAKKQEKHSRLVGYMKEVNDAAGGNS
jgi:hypothetical protein